MARSETFLSFVFFIFLVVCVSKALVVELLLDEAEICGDVLQAWHVVEFFVFSVDFVICNYSELKTHRANHQNGNIVQHHCDERPPEEYKSPSRSQSSIDKH